MPPQTGPGSSGSSVLKVTRAARRELWRCSLHHFLNDGYAWSLYPLLPLMAAEFQLGYGATGAIKTTLNLLLSALGIPFGLLAERIGEIAVLTLGTVIYGAGIASLGLAWSYSSLLALVFIAGAGGGASHPVGSSLVSKTSSPRRMGTSLGILNFAGDVGKVVLPVTTGILAAWVGWRLSLSVIGLTGIGLALGLSRLKTISASSDKAPDVFPEGKARHQLATSKTDSGSAWSRWGVKDWWSFAFLNLIGILDSLPRSAVAVFASFVLLEKGLHMTSVGGFLGLLAAGGAAGKLLCGPLADAIGKRNTVIVTEAMTALGIAAFLHSNVFWTGPSLLFLGTFLNGTSSVLYALVPTVTRESRRSRGFGIYYTVTLAASGAAPLIYGFIGDAVGLQLMLYLMAGMVLLTIPLTFALRIR